MSSDHDRDRLHLRWRQEYLASGPCILWVEAYPPKTDTVGLKPGQEKLHYGGSSKRSGLVPLNIGGINECL